MPVLEEAGFEEAEVFEVLEVGASLLSVLGEVGLLSGFFFCCCCITR